MSDSKLKKWLPACFHTLSQSETHLSGYVSSESELQSVLECYSRVTLTSFVKWSDDKARIKKRGSKRRLLWKFEDYSNDVPLTIQNRQILSCQFGKAKPKPEQQVALTFSFAMDFVYQWSKWASGAKWCCPYYFCTEWCTSQIFYVISKSQQCVFRWVSIHYCTKYWVIGTMNSNPRTTICDVKILVFMTLEGDPDWNM